MENDELIFLPQFAARTRERVNEHNQTENDEQKKERHICIWSMDKNHWEHRQSKRVEDVIHDPTNETQKKKNLHQFVISNDGIAGAGVAGDAAANDPIT